MQNAAKSVNVYIDLEGFGPQALARSGSRQIAAFLKNVRPFFEHECIEVRKIVGVASLARSIVSIEDHIREYLDEIFDDHKAKLIWSRTPNDLALQAEVEKDAAAETLPHHVMILTQNQSLIPLLEKLKTGKHRVIVCGQKLTNPLRRAAERALCVREVLPSVFARPSSRPIHP